MKTMMMSCAVLVAAMAGLAGCQHVGNSWEQDAVRSVDKSASNARAGMVDAEGNWNASGPQMAGSTSVAKDGISRNTGGVPDDMVFWDGKTLGYAGQKDTKIKNTKLYTADGKLVADIGELVSNASSSTRASNEALDRVKEIVATVTPAQMQTAIEQARAGNETAQLFLRLAAAVATSGATEAVGAVGAGVDAIAK